jgi:hypothetical protein
MYVEGRVLTSSGEPIPGAVIETWETDDKGEPLTVPPFPSFSLFSLLTVDRRTSSLPPKATTTLSTPNAPHQTAEVG